jgi:hypothetical protein
LALEDGSGVAVEAVAKLLVAGAMLPAIHGDAMNQPCVEVYEAFEIDYTPFALPDATFRPHFVIYQAPPAAPGSHLPHVWMTFDHQRPGDSLAWQPTYADFDEAARVGREQAHHAIDRFRQSTPD